MVIALFSLCIRSVGAQNAPERNGVKHRVHGFEQCKLRARVLLSGDVARDERRHSGGKNRCEIFGHFGPVQEQRSEALLANLVNHNMVHCAQCRGLADACQKTCLSKEVAWSEATDLLRVGVIAMFSDNDARLNNQGAIMNR